MPTEAGRMRALADRLVTPALVVYPVRHHSPACAWQLRRLFAECAPSVVLVEGPRSFTPLVPLLVHPQARMPLAIYTYAVQRGGEDEAERRRAAYHPFCDHSPELVALREAQARGLPARFIDLDFAEQCQLEAGDDAAETSLLDERHFQRSQALQLLAERLGCRDHEELWEHLFETDIEAVGWREHIARLAAYCQLTREEYSEQALSADGTLQREAEMAWHIQQAVAARAPGQGPVLAVLGGFHAVAMPALLARPPARPKIPRGALGEEDSALIRYGHERLDRLNGYAAGMTSPAWHQALWERMLRQDSRGKPGGGALREEAALAMLAEIALQLRGKHGIALPMPALAAAYEQALRLAQLRGRPAPLRNDVMDSVTSCFIKGDADADGGVVLAVARRALCGDAMGQVPPGAHVPPLVRDVAWRLRRQRLKVDDSQPRRTALELYRRPAHRITSRLLHGLAFLGVPFAVRTAGPDFAQGIGLERLREHWDYAYTAATEGALVEASVHGTSLPAAVAHGFARQLDQMQGAGQARDARAAASMLVRACMLGLHDHLARVVAMLRMAIAEDADFAAVVAAISQLGLLYESREPLEARELDEMPDLLAAGYHRALYLGRHLQGAADAEASVRGLIQLRELLISQAGQALDGSLYADLLAGLQQHDAAWVRGAATGLRYSAGALDAAGIGAALAGHFGGLGPAPDSVAFLRGLLQTAREVAWQQPEVLRVLDTLIGAWSAQEFIAHLPDLRLAFAAMTPKETERIAGAVAGLHGQDALGSLLHRELDAAQVARHLAWSATVANLLANDGLDAWVAR